jgi:isopentenyl-diphosphate delta-isomerase
MNMKQEVILVDENDTELGVADKLDAHKKGLLHRAFSVFVFNSRGEMLLQQRAFSKYHSPGLWTNACCSHPAPGEELEEAVERRLREEIGLTVPAKRLFDFIYYAHLDHGLTEHELDHVYVAETDDTPFINPEEVNAIKYADLAALESEITAHPYRFTVWFRILFPKIKETRQNLFVQ